MKPMAAVEARLAALREFLKARSGAGSVFLVEGGAEYHTQEDPLDYLREHRQRQGDRYVRTSANLG